FLARLGKRSTNQALQRAPAERRYPILVAFLRQALEETIDEAIDLFDRCLARASARAERQLEEIRLASARTTDEAGRPFGQTGRIVLDASVADRQVRKTIYRQVTPEMLREAVERTEAHPVVGTTTTSTSWPTATTPSASSRRSSSMPSRSGPTGLGLPTSRPSSGYGT